MRIPATLTLLLFSVLSFSQIPEGPGTYSDVRQSNIKSITKLYIKYSDSTENDSIVRERLHFNKKGQLTLKEIPSQYSTMERHIYYHYNHQGYLVRADSSGLFGSGYGSIGDDTLYSHLEETWENFQSTQRIFKRRTTTDNWESYNEIRYFYDSLGRLTQERTIHVDTNISDLFQSRVEYEYEVGSFPRMKTYFFEEIEHSRVLYVYDYF